MLSRDAAPDHVYVEVSDEHAFVSHTPARAAVRRDCAVLFCPPFGWEELASHRALRAWARDVARDGYPAARLAYPGSGDSSGSPSDPGRLPAAIAAVEAAADWLREREAVEHVVAIGIGFGGLVAYLTAARTDALDGIVLWATPRRGRELLRQLRAFSRLEMSEAFGGLPDPPPLPDGALEAGGFLLSAETTAALEQIDLVSEPVARAPAFGALLLGRDERAADEALQAALREHGVAVTTAAGPGFAAMTSHPQDAVAPANVQTSVSAWLDEHVPPATAELPEDRVPAPGECRELVLGDGQAAIVEEPIAFESAGTQLSGILTRPEGLSAPVCAVFVNAGAIHRVGPNRMWVETARRWGAIGVPSLRLDLDGIGEAAGGDLEYVDTACLHDMRLIDQVQGALDELVQRGVAERFVLIGMCSGAFWSLQLALRDPRIVSVQLLNLVVVEWDESLGPMRSLRAISLRSFANLRRADTRARLRATLRWVLARGRARLRVQRDAGSGRTPLATRIETTVQQLIDSGVQVLLLFTAREPLEADLSRRGLMDRLRDAPNVTIANLEVASHTLRPQVTQAQTRPILDAELARTLGSTGDGVTLSGARMRSTPTRLAQRLRNTSSAGQPRNRS